MRLAILFALFTLPAFSADVTVSTFDSVQYFGNGGEVACNPAGTACVWATSQYQNAGFSSSSEIAGCLGGYAGGVFQCTAGTTTCLTCGNDASLFSYVPHNPSTVTKGQPHFEVAAGNYLFLWVSAQGLSGCPTSPMPGEGKCGDAWYVPFSISGSTISLTGPATNVTMIASTGSSTNGVLFARTGGTNAAGYHLFMSYRFANAMGGISSCQSGAWGVRVWPYTIPFSSLGTELAGGPFQPIGNCSYLEMSGFYDVKSGEFTFQGTPTGTSGGGPPYTWQNNIYGFNLQYTGSADLIVPWGTDLVHYAWNEHASTDASNSFIVWSSSAGPTANSYDGSQPMFGNCGAGCTGYLPLDKWVAVIPRYNDSAGYPHIGQIANAYQLTSVNVRGSPDRAIVCAADGGCNAMTVFSGGYADYSQPNTITELIKDVAGNAALYGIALLTQTTRAMGAVTLSGAVKIK